VFEQGASPHPPRNLYRSYLDQSHVFVAIYWQRYGWIAPDMDISGLEDEYRLSNGKPRLVYVKRPAPEREPGLEAMLDDIRDKAGISYKPFSTPAERRSSRRTWSRSSASASRLAGTRRRRGGSRRGCEGPCRSRPAT
jgi:Domain of unknown function (DUF4062)